MLRTSGLAGFLLAALMLAPDAQGQTPAEDPAAGVAPRSTGKALALNMLLPGLGHRYLNHGHWSRGAVVHASADVASWLLLIDTSWRHAALTRDFQTYAAAHAGAQVEGKDRRFFLDMAGYGSTDEFIESMLRDRRWDRLGYADDPAFYWKWESEELRLIYGNMREDAESLRRRRPVLITMLVGNRLIAAVTTIATGARSRSPAELSFAPSEVDGVSPTLRAVVRF